MPPGSGPVPLRRLLVDLSDPAVGSPPAVAADLPAGMFVWCILSVHSTAEQRRWAHREISSTCRWSLNNEGRVLIVPRIAASPSAADALSGEERDAVTWIVHRDDNLLRSGTHLATSTHTYIQCVPTADDRRMRKQ